MKVRILMSAITIMLSLVQISAQETYKIGDVYKQNGIIGVVFYVDNTGHHGKIISIEEFYDSWTTVSSMVGATSTTDGMKNMNIIKSQPNWRTNFRLFAKVADMGVDWYIPAKDELFQIGLQAKKINYTLSMYGYKVLSSNYYSSTEVSETSVWNIWIDGRLDCYEVVKNGGGSIKTRAIRKF